ncbi:MAG: DNA polymerase III subunit delta [Verrucomicrobia bacterium]|nr:MAG: DNA polymerase III subunit delta [Verrucomicrobiota bacterium]
MSFSAGCAEKDRLAACAPRSCLEQRNLVMRLLECDQIAVPKTKTKTGTTNIYAVVGSDEAEVKHVAAELAAKLAPPDAGDFGLEIIDGAADNTEQAAARIRSTIEALQTLPFFGSIKVVWLKNANFLGDDQKARSTPVQTALEELSALIEHGFGSEVTFLISAIDVDKRRGFYKTLVKRAELQVFDRLDSARAGWEEEATEIVRRRAKKRKLQFDDDALDLFVLLTGGDTRQIENELEKIDTFLGKDCLARVDVVRELVPLSRAGVIFELSNALARRDLDLALTLVRRLLEQGENAVGILLVAIVPTVRNLLLAKDLMERHALRPPHSPFQFISVINRLPAKATDHLPRKKDGSINAYALGIAAQHAHQFDTNDLIEAMRACLDANLKLVTTQLDHELILTEVVVRLLGE